MKEYNNPKDVNDIVTLCDSHKDVEFWDDESLSLILGIVGSWLGLEGLVEISCLMYIGV